MDHPYQIFAFFYLFRGGLSPENAWCISGLSFEMIAKSRRVLKSAGKRDLRDRIGSRAKHLCCYADTVPQQILFGRELRLLYKYFVEIGAVDADMTGNFGYADIVGIIVVNIIGSFLKIEVSEIGFLFRSEFLQIRKKEQQITDRAQRLIARFQKRIYKSHHRTKKCLKGCGRIVVKNKGVRKNGLRKQIFTFFAVKPDPGITPGIFLIRLIIGGFQRRN